MRKDTPKLHWGKSPQGLLERHKNHVTIRLIFCLVIISIITVIDVTLSIIKLCIWSDFRVLI